MKTVIIDNYDSFTYNLSHLVKQLGAEVTVVRNDRFRMDSLRAYDNIILSPGPGIPSEAGLLTEVIRTYAGKKPILGVCLGHQAIGEVFGATLQNLSEVFHGVATPCRVVADDPLFRGLGDTRPLPLMGSGKGRAARLPRSDCRERRGAYHGIAPQDA